MKCGIEKGLTKRLTKSTDKGLRAFEAGLQGDVNDPCAAEDQLVGGAFKPQQAHIGGHADAGILGKLAVEVKLREMRHLA